MCSCWQLFNHPIDILMKLLFSSLLSWCKLFAMNVQFSDSSNPIHMPCFGNKDRVCGLGRGSLPRQWVRGYCPRVYYPRTRLLCPSLPLTHLITSRHSLIFSASAGLSTYCSWRGKISSLLHHHYIIIGSVLQWFKTRVHKNKQLE